MSRLCLERIYYPVLTLGYGKRLGLWVRGCSRNCYHCTSPELQDYGGETQEVADIIRAIPEDFQADGLTISGGEPFDQAEGILELIHWFREKISDDVLVYTGYTLAELQAREDPVTDQILREIAVLIDGPYVEALNDNRGIRGSSNQKIYIWKYPERYRDADGGERTVQFVGEEHSLLQIGVPPKSENIDGHE